VNSFVFEIPQIKDSNWVFQKPLTEFPKLQTDDLFQFSKGHEHIFILYIYFDRHNTPRYPTTRVIIQMPNRIYYRTSVKNLEKLILSINLLNWNGNLFLIS